MITPDGVTDQQDDERRHQDARAGRDRHAVAEQVQAEPSESRHQQRQARDGQGEGVGRTGPGWKRASRGVRRWREGLHDV